MKKPSKQDVDSNDSADDKSLDAPRDADQPRKKGKSPPEKLTAAEIWEREGRLTKQERRKRYKCGSKFTRFSQVEPWVITYHMANKKKGLGKEGKSEKEVLNRRINQKISLWKGDITKLEVEAIVNAANQALLGGGGIDGAIHSAAGEALYQECKLLKGCATGFTKITRAHNLPSQYILHTIGPVGEYPEKLKSCYESCLQLCCDYNIKTVAFCGISTGIFGYPLENASKVACEVIRKWMENGRNLEKIERIVFCTFLDKEYVCYQKLMKHYFPVAPDNDFVTRYLKVMENYKSDDEEKKQENLNETNNTKREKDSSTSEGSLEQSDKQKDLKEKKQETKKQEDEQKELNDQNQQKDKEQQEQQHQKQQNEQDKQQSE